MHSQVWNWMQKLMKTISTPTHKPVFVVGPLLSPFNSPAMDSENLVACALGIGVTPAISLIKQYSNTSRPLNLVWICQDPGLVKRFLQNAEFGSDGYTLIFYTRKERSIILRDATSNVFSKGQSAASSRLLPPEKDCQRSCPTRC